jgi:hypothetical protein
MFEASTSGTAAPDAVIGSDRRRPAATASSAGETRLSWRAEMPGCLVMLALGLLWLAGNASSIPLPADCAALPGAVVFGIDTQVMMTATSGASCPLSMRIAEASIDDIEIVSPPRNGTAMTDRRKVAIYRANENFRGDDSFAVAIRGRSPIFTGTSVVRVHVTVRDRPSTDR